MDRVLLTELKEFLTERMVDNMSTKDLVEYVSNDLFQYFDKLGEHEFLEEANNYWGDSFGKLLTKFKTISSATSKQLTDHVTVDKVSTFLPQSPHWGL